MSPASRSPGRPSRDRPPPNRSAAAQGRSARPTEARGRGQRPPRRSSDLLARVLVGVPAAVVAIVFVDLGGTAWALFMLALSWVCLHELYRMLPRWKPSPIVGFAAAAAMVLAARFGTERDVMEVAVASIPVTFLAVMVRGGDGTPSVSIAGTLLGIFWLGLAFAHAVLLRRLDNGSGILIDILVGTFLGDTAAYIGGRVFGRRLLAPSISPKKTWEGLFCGMLIAILSVFIAGLEQTWLTQGDALVLGVVVAVIGPIGDLFESLIKRDAGIKDAGSVFGAHGGALDRLDAVIFTVVAGYYVWVTLPHV
jgi:phosphatidate cytidylyltransferase